MEHGKTYVPFVTKIIEYGGNLYDVVVPLFESKYDAQLPENMYLLKDDKQAEKFPEFFSEIEPETADDEAEMQRIVREDQKWFEENVGADFSKFLQSKEFNEFFDANEGMSVRMAMKQFVEDNGCEYVRNICSK